MEPANVIPSITEQTVQVCLYSSLFAKIWIFKCKPSFLSTKEYCYAPTTCKGKGDCKTDGSCQCDANYYGNDCNCHAPTTCKGKGDCKADGTCLCDANYYKADCSSM